MITNFFGLLIFGSLILLSILLIANPLKVNNTANFWFGIFLLLWASFWIEEILLILNIKTYSIQSITLFKFLQFLTPLIFYISIRFYTNPDFNLTNKGFLYLILPTIYLSFLIFSKLFGKDLKSVLLALMLVHSFAFTFLSLLHIRKHKKNIKQYASSIQDIDLIWIELIVWSFVFLIIAISFFNVVFYDAPLNSYMNILIYLIVVFTAYHALKQKEIYAIDSQERAEVFSIYEETDKEEFKNKIISDEKIIELKTQLHDILLKEELYLDPEISLSKLAKKINLTSHQLSYLINTGFNKNFYEFINKFRVDKAKKLLHDKAYKKYSILGIAYEAGFNSKTSFNTTFKKITGLTPTDFKKNGSDL